MEWKFRKRRGVLCVWHEYADSTLTYINPLFFLLIEIQQRLKKLNERQNLTSKHKQKRICIDAVAAAITAPTSTPMNNGSSSTSNKTRAWGMHHFVMLESRQFLALFRLHGMNYTTGLTLNTHTHTRSQKMDSSYGPNVECKKSSIEKNCLTRMCVYLLSSLVVSLIKYFIDKSAQRVFALAALSLALSINNRFYIGNFDCIFSLRVPSTNSWRKNIIEFKTFDSMNIFVESMKSCVRHGSISTWFLALFLFYYAHRQFNFLLV